MLSDYLYIYITTHQKDNYHIIYYKTKKGCTNMAVELMKLNLIANAISTTKPKPTVTKYFAKVATADIDDSGANAVVTIAAGTGDTNHIYADDGTKAATLSTITSDGAGGFNGYYLLFINGALQQSSYYSITSGNISIPNAGPSAAPLIKENDNVSLVVTIFAPTTDTTVTIS